MAGLPSPIQQLIDDRFSANDLEIFIKRDDLIHPEIMGNKWRKMKYNLLEIKKQKATGLLTFGGAFSNHIAAAAAAAFENGLNSVGIIRGDELTPSSNHTLRFASSKGMQLVFVSRDEFRRLKLNPRELQETYPYHYILPEGGTNKFAMAGCEEIIAEFDREYDYVITAFGTGGTMAGLLKGMKGNGKLLGISSLKGNWIDPEFERLCAQFEIPYRNYQIVKDFHFGGYGKVTDQLIDFINDTKKQVDIPLDPIYTGKMYFGVMSLINQGFFPSGSKILLIHTGGLQGIDGYNEKATRKIVL